MKIQKLDLWIRLLLVICGLALIAVLFVPMWGIDLVAPQYPEGLRLLIYPDKLAGNVDIINGLNHYIGMKTLHTDDFIEFKVLPYIIMFFVAAFVLTGLVGKRKLLYVLFFLFVGFGILAMVDFWRWEYDYGHNLNPEAAIIVPGMAYQPPLIGFKQLLNFGAYSMASTGGWIFVSAGVILLFCTILAWRKGRVKKQATSKNVMVAFSLVICFASCDKAPDPILLGKDNCYSCKMTISSEKFGAEIVTVKGKTYKFDDSKCLLSFLGSGYVARADIHETYLTDFCEPHSLLPVTNCKLLKSVELRGPMGGDIAAFSHADSLKKMQQFYPGTLVGWDEINK